MSPQLRSLLLTTHVSTSVASIGAVAAFLALALIGIIGGSLAARGAYLGMEVIAWFVILPFFSRPC